MRFIGLLITLLITLSFKHPHYLSVADLKYNPKEKALQGYVKIFTHDFEKELKQIHQRPVDLINPADTSKTRSMLNKYLQDHFKITINNKNLTYNVIGYELEQESVYMYVESQQCESPTLVSFYNIILHRSFKEQNNIIHMEVNGKRQSKKLSNPENQAIFNF